MIISEKSLRLVGAGERAESGPAPAGREAVSLSSVLLGDVRLFDATRPAAGDPRPANGAETLGVRTAP